MLLSGEFESPGVTLDKSQIPIDLDEAKWRVERAAYLNCGPAQYKMVSAEVAALTYRTLAHTCTARRAMRMSTLLLVACLTRCFRSNTMLSVSSCVCMLSSRFNAECPCSAASQNNEVEADMGECCAVLAECASTDVGPD